MTSRHIRGEDLVVFPRENIKFLFNELVLFTEHEHLVFTAAQLLYVPKHNVGERHGSHVFEELV